MSTCKVVAHVANIRLHFGHLPSTPRRFMPPFLIALFCTDSPRDPIAYSIDPSSVEIVAMDRTIFGGSARVVTCRGPGVIRAFFESTQPNLTHAWDVSLVKMSGCDLRRNFNLPVAIGNGQDIPSLQQRMSRPPCVYVFNTLVENCVTLFSVDVSTFSLDRLVCVLRQLVFVGFCLQALGISFNLVRLDSILFVDTQRVVVDNSVAIACERSLPSVFCVALVLVERYQAVRSSTDCAAAACSCETNCPAAPCSVKVEGASQDEARGSMPRPGDAWDDRAVVVSMAARLRRLCETAGVAQSPFVAFRTMMREFEKIHDCLACAEVQMSCEERSVRPCDMGQL
jgi:hypothetical protein